MPAGLGRNNAGAMGCDCRSGQADSVGRIEIAQWHHVCWANPRRLALNEVKPNVYREG